MEGSNHLLLIVDFLATSFGDACWFTLPLVYCGEA
jgi:hypothetical protein